MGKCPYQRVKYLQSDSATDKINSYINTGLVFDDIDFEIEIEASIVEVVQYSAILTNEQGGVNFVRISALVSSSDYVVVNINTRSNSSIQVNNKEKHKYKLEGKNNTLILDDEVFFLGEEERELNNPNPLIIFSPPNNYGNVQVYSFKYTKRNKTFMELIPVRIGDEGFMYDKVSGKLFGNAGTGKFILGPDIN